MHAVNKGQPGRRFPPSTESEYLDLLYAGKNRIQVPFVTCGEGPRFCVVRNYLDKYLCLKYRSNIFLIFGLNNQKIVTS